MTFENFTHPEAESIVNLLLWAEGFHYNTETSCEASQLLVDKVFKVLFSKVEVAKP